MPTKYFRHDVADIVERKRKKGRSGPEAHARGTSVGATKRKITLTKALRTGRLTAEEVGFESVRCAFTDDDGVRCGYVVAWNGGGFVDLRASSGGEWRAVTRCTRRARTVPGCTSLTSHLTTRKPGRISCL